MPVQFASVVQDLSSVRLSKYDRGQGDEDTLKRYLSNTRLGASLYPLTQTIEIVVRNRIESVLIARYGRNWFASSRLQALHRSRKQRQPYDTTWFKIQGAIADISKAGYPVQSGRVVAELSLGTWVSFFRSRREVDFYIPNIRQLFPHLTGPYPKRRNIELELDEMRVLRNRIAHHEPIMFDPRLMAKHQNLLNLLETFSPESRKWLRATQADRFKRVYNSIFP